MSSQNNLESAGWFILVAVMWGGTNPFIKKGSRGIEAIKEDGKFRQTLSELIFLFSNWKYLLPFLINQSGSVVYYLTLATADISLAVPITNSLTFIFTILSGRLLGEKINNIQTYIGMVLVLIGVLLCVSDKW
ncbi:hypothetical protein FSP39_024503 [Pinctada imbricata]|uniref:Transmembrane protein 234-like protein n=1 Tax=Pinctada imbricata TaxID=66713 RepID=A0AA89BY87_PINIB|nr:hypothetical protein FSP39_024503 [Pinctada imbricata]